jgi:hypothetical protein
MLGSCFWSFKTPVSASFKRHNHLKVAMTCAVDKALLNQEIMTYHQGFISHFGQMLLQEFNMDISYCFTLQFISTFIVSMCTSYTVIL